MLKSKIIYLNVTKLYSSSYCRFASTSSSQDHYQILGVSRNATIEQIKSAYRELSKKHHPDVSQDPSSVELFKKISNAYSVLKDEKSRSNYDYGNSTSYDQPSSQTYQYSAKKSQSSQSSQSYSESSDSGASRARDSGVKSEEEALYESIFGKTFKEDPLFFYKAENEELRKKYHEALDKLKEKKGTKSQESSGAGASTASHEFYEESEEWRQFMRDYIRKRQGSYTAEETYNGMNREAFKRSPLPSWAKAFLALGSGVIIYFLTVEVRFDSPDLV